VPFLRRFFGGDPAVLGRQWRAEAARAAEGLDIEAAMAAHLRWKEQLQTQITGRPGADPAAPAPLDRDRVCRDDRCDLGHWIHGPGRARLGTFPGFTELLAHHRMFHHVAGNVLALDAAGQHGAARRMLDDQFEDYSGRVTGDLRLLQRVVSEVDAPPPA
jgi:hypothetical protein